MTSHDDDKNTLDFASHSSIVRRVYRIPVDPGDHVSVTIDGKSYPVLNIVDRGLQIACEAAGDLEEGKDLGGIELMVQGQSMPVKAEVVYTTKIDLDSYACGISMEFQNAEHAQKIKSFVDSKRNTLFDAGTS